MFKFVILFVVIYSASSAPQYSSIGYRNGYDVYNNDGYYGGYNNPRYPLATSYTNRYDGVYPSKFYNVNYSSIIDCTYSVSKKGWNIVKAYSTHQNKKENSHKFK